MEKTLKEIANYINNRGYDANEDYIEDGFVSISDRVSPNITSGDRYDNLVEKIKNLASELRGSKWGNLIDIEFERNDEWYGFRVSLKRQMKTGGSIKSSGTFNPLGSAKELGITPKIEGHDMIAKCDCEEKFSYQNSKKNIVWECPECKGMKRISE